MVYITRRNAPYASIQVSVFFLFSEMRLNETPNASGFGHFYFAKLRKCSFSAILWPIGLGEKKKKAKITERRITTLTAHPAPTPPALPGTPLQLSLSGFGTFSPLPILKTTSTPTTAPSRAEPGALGHRLGLPLPRSIFPVGAGPSARSGDGDAAAGAASPGASSLCTRASGRPLRPGKLIPRVHGWVAGALLPVFGARVRLFRDEEVGSSQQSGKAMDFGCCCILQSQPHSLAKP